jgi:predicted Zn-dependent protease
MKYLVCHLLLNIHLERLNLDKLGLVLTLIVCTLLQGTESLAKEIKTEGQIAARPQARTQGVVYGQFRSQYGVIRWISEQMPLKVYVAHGQTLDAILDEEAGAPICNVDNLAHWPDVVANLLQDPEGISKLPIAQGYSEEHYQAVTAGISAWKPFEKEGLFSFAFTDDPSEADIYVFFVNHFVNKIGFGLTSNDIRGYTAKRSFPLKAVLSGQQVDFRPVVIQMRVTGAMGQPQTFKWVQAGAAHEFGHALGIEGHSPNPGDLMNINYGYQVISPNDAATIRYLYHVTPDLIP